VSAGVFAPDQGVANEYVNDKWHAGGDRDQPIGNGREASPKRQVLTVVHVERGHEKDV